MQNFIAPRNFQRSSPITAFMCLNEDEKEQFLSSQLNSIQKMSALYQVLCYGLGHKTMNKSNFCYKVPFPYVSERKIELTNPF